MNIGDKAELRHGPFKSVWEVTDINEHGAVLTYIGPVHYVGFEKPEVAPNGTQLTFTPRDTWIGKAHWPSVELI